MPALFADWAGRWSTPPAVAPGQSVLDVACGTGVVARAAADRVGPTGPVVGLDANEAMLAVARRLRPDLRWQLGDACALPFADGSFDVVVSQAALMFFGDRVAALREMGRVAGRRRVVVQVPGRLAASPGYLALTEVGRPPRRARRRVDLLGAYFARGRAGPAGRACSAAAGLRIDRFETWTGRDPAGLDRHVPGRRAAAAGRRVDQAVRERIIDDCRTALAPFVDPAGAVAAPIEVHLITARALPGVRAGGPVDMLCA